MSALNWHQVMQLAFWIVLTAHAVSAIVQGFNCSQSELCQSDIEKIRTLEIQEKILTELGMTSIPNVSHISLEMRQVYEELAETLMDTSDDHVETTTEFIQGTDASGGEDLSQLMASFEFPSRMLFEDLLEAKLFFVVDMLHKHLAQDLEVKVIAMTEDGYQGETIATKTYSVAGRSRIEIPLPVEIVKNWYTDSPIGGLFVAALVEGRNVAVHPQQSSRDQDLMLLQLTTTVSGARSKRRAIPVCSMESPSEGCCLYDLLIDFPRIGWNWIIAPKRYNAYVCKGNCRLNAHHFALAEQGHTKIMKVADRMRNVATSNLGDVGYCCHPTEYDHLKMIYVNRAGEIKVGNVNGMVARQCSCS